MQVINTLKTICGVIITSFLFGCNKEKLQNAIVNSGPSYNYGSSLTSYEVRLKRLSLYPAGATIYIEKFWYQNSDSSRYYSNVLFDNSLPANDTTLIQVEVLNRTMYLKWKILSANKDSLSGGTTPRLTTSANQITFEINY